jgi:hypothetical protein
MTDSILKIIAHVWGAWGRQFESAHPDLMKISKLHLFCCTFSVSNSPIFCPILLNKVHICNTICCFIVAKEYEKE